MAKKDYEDFENSTECWICYNNYIDGDGKFYLKMSHQMDWKSIWALVSITS